MREIEGSSSLSFSIIHKKGCWGYGGFHDPGGDRGGGVWEYQDGAPPPNLMDMYVCDQLQLQNWYWHKKSPNVVVLSF